MPAKRLRHHELLHEPLHVPARIAKIGRQPIEQLRMARRLPLRAEIVARLHQARAEQICCHSRLTATRAVSGFSGDTSQLRQIEPRQPPGRIVAV